MKENLVPKRSVKVHWKWPLAASYIAIAYQPIYSFQAKVTKAASATYNLASNLYLGIVEDFDASLLGNRSDPVNQAALTIKWDDPVQVMEKPRTGYNSGS